MQWNSEPLTKRDYVTEGCRSAEWWRMERFSRKRKAESKRKRMLNDFTGFSKPDTISQKKWSGHDLNFNIRVWSWLRMNAGGVLNTCKSNEEELNESFGRISSHLSGGRVSNVWATCPILGNNHWKRWLIPHVITGGHPLVKKGFIRYRMGPHLIS